MEAGHELRSPGTVVVNRPELIIAISYTLLSTSLPCIAIIGSRITGLFFRWVDSFKLSEHNYCSTDGNSISQSRAIPSIPHQAQGWIQHFAKRG